MFADSFSETLGSLLPPLKLMPSSNPPVGTPLLLPPLPLFPKLCALCPPSFHLHENPFSSTAFKEVWFSPMHSALPAAGARFQVKNLSLIHAGGGVRVSILLVSYASCPSTFLHFSVTAAAHLRELLVPRVYLANRDWARTSPQVLCCKPG